MPRAPYPVFPVKLVGFEEFHAAFLNESRTRAIFGTAYRKYGYLPGFGRCGIPPVICYAEKGEICENSQAHTNDL
jgi:hypothetical protein